MILFWVGYLYYLITNKNVKFFYKLFVRLHALTNGKSTGFINKIVKNFHINKFGELKLDDYNHSYFKYTDNDIALIVEQIKNDGYIVLDQILPEHLTNRLLHFAQTNIAVARETDENNGIYFETKFDGTQPEAVRYEYKLHDLMASDVIQSIVADKLFISIANKYLGSMPILDVVQMWWHTNFKKIADKKAAQYYHYDLDRLKWLKFFIYITDVDESNGPHSFIKKSHIPETIPNDIYKKGYMRIDDELIFKNFDKSDEVVFCGKKGTIIIEDTIGLHKGNHVSGKSRLIMQIQFSNSLFGMVNDYEYYDIENKINIKDPNLSLLNKQVPVVLSEYYSEENS
jgi:ectoine hydroxylase-related dioxygenase (phytanoyl-CoA dioxygenase family)